MLLKNLRPADEYHKFASIVLEPWDLLFLSRIRQLALSRKDLGTIVDIGTATGVVPVKLAQDAKLAGWHFIGIDLDPAMIEEGQPDLIELGLVDRVSLQVGDAMALPLGDATVEIAASRATLHHLPDKAESLREMYRVLSPGGVGIVHDMRRDAPDELLQKFANMRAESGYPPTHLEEKLTLAEARELIDEAGLSDDAIAVSSERGFGAMGFEILIRKPSAQ